MERKDKIKLILKIIFLSIGIVLDIIIILSYTLSLPPVLDTAFLLTGWFFGPISTFFGIIMLLPTKRSLGIFLVILGIVIFLLGVIYYAIPGPYTYFDSYKYISTKDQISKYFTLLGCLGGGILLLIIGLVLWVRSASIKRIKHRVKKIGEDSKKIVHYLKADNSGITRLKLASVLQIDRTKMKKCLNHLEWLGVVEKKKVSAEETLLFYKKYHEEDN
ncbi:MAG: hypothetical protein ACFFC1_08430 [Promethearchaeota archaeon]